MNRLVLASVFAVMGIACSASTGDEIASSSAAIGTCSPGYLYCGQHPKVNAQLAGAGLSTEDVYRCNEDRSLTVVQRCAAGCEVRSSAEDDGCKGSGGTGPDLAVFPPRAGSQIYGKNASGAVVPRNAPTLVKDPSVEYFMLATAPTEGGFTVYSDALRIDRQNGMCETADKVRVDGTLIDNPDRSAGSGGVRKLLRFDAAVLNAGTSSILFGGPATSADRSTGATSSRLVDRRLFSYSPCHAHDHMNGFATYRLLAADGTPVASGNVPVTGRKQGFCIGDTVQYGSGASQIASLVNNRCNDMVLSPSFADVYMREDSFHRRFLGGQWIDVTGVPAGTYMVEIEVNPAIPVGDGEECANGLVKCDGACRLFCETDYGNNKGSASVTIPETPCVPSSINDGSSSSPDAIMSSPESVFRQRLVDLSGSVASTCGAIVGGVACEDQGGADAKLTAHTQNGCTLRYHWERYRTGTVGSAGAELEVTQGCVQTNSGQTCSATVTSSCYVRPYCSPAREYFDVWRDSCGVEYKQRVPSADYACP